jgi:hypothetical protein
MLVHQLTNQTTIPQRLGEVTAPIHGKGEEEKVKQHCEKRAQLKRYFLIFQVQ